MKYKQFDIIKTEDGRFIIMAAFNEQATKYYYKSRQEAKDVIDNVILPKVGKYRYIPCHYKHFIWTILDNKTHRNLEIDGKLLKFPKREDAVKWCDENNELLNI